MVADQLRSKQVVVLRDDWPHLQVIYWNFLQACRGSLSVSN
jgi:hypothetical protein